MKITPLVLLTILLITGCKNNEEGRRPLPKDISQTDITTSIYPENISKVFDAHGGIDNWNTMKTLSFSINRPNGKEVITTDLKTRAERIDAPTYTLGFDGIKLWVDEKEGVGYQGNGRFYKGLMFYFYAMPFVLADNGIIYNKAKPLNFEGKTYPGILISYEPGIGVSPDDQYVIYYDSKTGQMQWLSYTVTFGKDEKSKDFYFIRYNNWQIINGLLMPESMDWYNCENNLPIDKRNTVIFSDVLLSKEQANKQLFSKPLTAREL